MNSASVSVCLSPPLSPIEADQKNCSSASSGDFTRMPSARLTDGVADQLALDHDVDQSGLDSALYRSAANGKIDDFKDNKDLLLDQLLTPNKNTIMHIHITSAKTDRKTDAQTKFAEEILRLCPALLLQTNAKGETPLHLAARYGHRRMVELLIERAKAGHEDLECGNQAAKEMLRATNKGNDTALHEAVRFGHLQVAAYRGHDKSMKEIISCCPDSCELVDHKGQNVLHHAMDGGWGRAVKVILDDYSLSNLLNEKDIDGNTPLLHAATSLKYNVDLNHHPRVDRMAFNNQNQNSRDIVSTLDAGDDIQKKLQKRMLTRLLGPRSTLRTPVTLKKDAAGREKTEEDYDHRVHGEGTSALLVAATVIATVTFAAGFTLPGGLVSNDGPLQGTAILRSTTAFTTFIIADSIAFVLSTASVLAIMSFILFPGKSTKLKHEFSFFLTTCAMVAMQIAFLSGTYAVMFPSSKQTSVFLFIYLCFIILPMLTFGVI